MTPAEQIAHHIERLRPAPAAPAPATTPERARIVAAAERVAQALAADPTLNHHRRARPVDAFAETLRQAHPIARQADLYAAHQALAQRTDPEAERERNQLGKTNPTAPAELVQLAERAEHHAAAVEAAARPDWHTPAASRQLSAQMLPAPQALAAIADQLRRAVADAKVSAAHRELEQAQSRAAAEIEQARTEAARQVEAAQEAQRQAERRADRAEADREAVTEAAKRERTTAAERLREHQAQMDDLRERATRAEAQREEERADSRRYAAQVEQLRAQLAERDQPTT